MNKVIIVGAGINGLVAANYLVKNSFDVSVIEKKPYTGGACIKVGAIPVHLFAGIWGTLAVGIFGASAGFDQFMVQLASVGIVGVFCVVCTFIIGLAVKSIMGLRVSEEEEDKGLDIAEHGTGAYGDFSMR